jgi:hypothetical protein
MDLNELRQEIETGDCVRCKALFKVVERALDLPIGGKTFHSKSATYRIDELRRACNEFMTNLGKVQLRDPLRPPDMPPERCGCDDSNYHRQIVKNVLVALECWQKNLKHEEPESRDRMLNCINDVRRALRLSPFESVAATAQPETYTYRPKIYRSESLPLVAAEMQELRKENARLRLRLGITSRWELEKTEPVVEQQRSTLMLVESLVKAAMDIIQAGKALEKKGTETR